MKLVFSSLSFSSDLPVGCCCYSVAVSASYSPVLTASFVPNDCVDRQRCVLIGAAASC